MSEVKKLEIAFEDKRGIIMDIFSHAPKDHGALITFTKNAQRANHYHKESTQYTFLVEGSLLMRTSNVSKEGELSNIYDEIILEPYTLVKHNPFEAHAFKANCNSIILAFACGLRGGNDYEKDVYRIIQNMFDM
tara:strand:+ start:370 stop:771 length:402 start_codon:yes stop_codon:yes gene_type:complete